ncbi:FKBP-type peptidyl-prolyl cis-trans isomerase [Reichenbachiella sp. MALMAid0571]|uniref:FKBP-type peptidyl-prolyl cis-trans isomerase n=1 Tax=Reichenbachiella sp. MALMAid0571 TaxID=3143939 RepID=UPI0032DE5577
MNNELEKLSYSLGVNVAMSLQSQGLDEVDTKLFGQAIDDVLKGSDLQIDPQEAGNILNAHFSKLQSKQHESAIKEGQEFLESNKANEGVVTLESGLQYQVLKEGTGAKPSIDSTVTTHYHGTTIDGSVFDSSVERGTPASFPVNGVIAGWTEALQLMPLGSKWKLFVPSDLAYGDRGAGPKIGPHTTLIFEVELLEIK